MIRKSRVGEINPWISFSTVYIPASCIVYYTRLQDCAKLTERHCSPSGDHLALVDAHFTSGFLVKLTLMIYNVLRRSPLCRIAD
ncbi:hypothetical protein IAQ61_006424 [Plenodomus lingam]|uniref:uncharacterized protein n=1 Tax=Leptosphaeria maculans TaxID=5022 RepID=UPI0033225F3F|nr:hypothetical protein IAQ61_006424 [Plenodomus lingam]